LAYQPKVQYYFNSLGLSERCLGFDRFSGQEIYAHLIQGWQDRAAIRAQLETRIPEMKKEAFKAAEFVAAIHWGEDLDATYRRLAAS
jgi:hypothetical protein